MFENENPTATIPEDGQGVTAPEETTEAPAEDNAGQGGTEETTTSEAAPSDEGEAVPEFVLPIRFNKESRSLSRDEAVALAQKGLLYESKNMEALYNRLDYIAAQRETSIEALVDGLIASDEAKYRAELEEKFGVDDESVIEDLMTVYRNKQQRKYEKVVNDRNSAEEKAKGERRQSLESRLANDFSEVKAEFPEIESFEALPKEVIDEAAKSGKDLLSCYLKYNHRENKKTSAAKETAAEAKRASTGNGGSAEFKTDNAFDAFLRGFNS